MPRRAHALPWIKTCRWRPFTMRADELIDNARAARPMSMTTKPMHLERSDSAAPPGGEPDEDIAGHHAAPHGLADDLHLLALIVATALTLPIASDAMGL